MSGSMSRREALALYQEVKTAEDMRAMLAGDLFFLMLVGLGRSDMNCDFLFDRCREVQASPDGHLDLWAREHYKSTIITVGLTIQNILNDPEITVGIFSHTRPNAKAFLKQIKREFESNALLQELFPHIRPPQKGEKRSWSEDDGLIVRRKSNPKEATVEAWGLVDGMPTGKHFKLMIYDDVVVPESVTTPEMIKKTTDAWRLSDNLGAQGGKVRMIGTRYHAADTYSTILKDEVIAPRIYPATVDGTYEGEPVFLSREALREKRLKQGSFVFACQMLQNPLADAAQGFKREWIRFYAPGKHPAGSNLYIVCDPAGAKKRHSDYTVIWVLALGDDGNIYLVDGARDRLNLTERTAALFRLHRKWRPSAVGYEQYGMQADIEHIRYVQEQEGYRFTVTPLGGSMPKNDRIRRLVPVFEQTRFFLPERLPMMGTDGRSHDLVQAFIEEEFVAFPVSGHDDMLDCASRVLDPAFPARFPLVSRPEANAQARMCITEYNPALFGASL